MYMREYRDASSKKKKDKKTKKNSSIELGQKLHSISLKAALNSNEMME